MAKSNRQKKCASPSQACSINNSRLRAPFGIFLVFASGTLLRSGAVQSLALASNNYSGFLTRLAATRLSFSKNDDEIRSGIGADHARLRSGQHEHQQLKEIAVTWMEKFQEALHDDGLSADRIALFERISNVFHPDECFWRDMVAFTWNIITMEGLWQIAEYIAASSFSRRKYFTYDWKLDPSKELVVTEQKNSDGGSRFNDHAEDNISTGTNEKRLLEFWATFSTYGGTGRAHIRLRLDSHGNKAYTLLTVLSGLHQRPWQCAPYQRPVLSPHGPIAGRRYWHENKSVVASAGDDNDVDQPFVLIIGGGQAGLSLGARLQLLQVPYLICESGTQPGSAWCRRYPSLCLHDPVYYNHLPYLPFPRTWPLFCPRDKLASWMKHYADALDLNVRCRTKVVGATWNVADREWSVQLQTTSKVHEDSDTRAESSTATLRVKHIVFATGNSSHPRVPSIAGRGVFRGLQVHSSQYEGGKAYRNKNLKHVVVIGSNNSAFDIVQDLWEQLMAQRDDGSASQLKSITMIQRTPSMIVSPDSVLRLGLGPLYAEDAALPHEEADLVATTVPYRLALEKWKQATNSMAENDRMMLDGVAKAGYRLDSGPDGTGIFAKSASQGGGFYINVGCAELLMRGDVEVRYVTVERLEEYAVLVSHKDTGREERLPADLIVYATGFHTMERWVSEICGKQISEKVGPTWGLGLGTEKDPGPWQGELRNMWKPTSVEGLWFQGGNLAQNRHYSRYLALQLAARHAGVETPVYSVAQPRDL